MRRVLLVMFLLCFAQSANALVDCGDGSSPRQQANRDRIGIISGGVGGTYARFAQDMADTLNEECYLRVVPMLGIGSVQNLADLIWMKGVDFAIVQSDVFEAFLQEELRGVDDIRKKIHYILKLYNEEIHLVARPEIKSIHDLAGKPVSVGLKGSGTNATASIVFQALDVRIKPTFLPNSEAVEAVRSGRVSAAFFVVGKPATNIKKFTKDDNLHLVPVNITERLQSYGYLESSFSGGDYPSLVPPGQPVTTIAVGAILTLYNFKPGTPRFELTSRFARKLMFNLDKMKDGAGGRFHKKWSEVDPRATVPGWVRFEPVGKLISSR